MKKRLLLIAMIGAICLTGCDVWYIKDKDGNQVIVKLGDGQTYTANELFEEYKGTQNGASEYYNAVYNVLIRAVQPKTTAINNEVASKMDSFTESARSAASTNGTLYSTELSNALDDKGVDELDELEELYYLDEQKSVYEDTYYDDHVSTDLLKEYIEYYAPYHIRHILVKNSADSSLYDGTISSDDAKNIASMVKRLASGKESFGVIAQTTASNGDSSSASIYGDVGIMDTTTGFVSEFKYSVYQFDKYIQYDANSTYNYAGKDASIEANIDAFDARQATRKIGTGTTAADAEGSSLIPADAESETFTTGTQAGKTVLNSSDGINFIPYNVFQELEDVANISSDTNGMTVYDGKTSYYPRNYLYNKYLNNHSMGFIDMEHATGEYSESRVTTIKVKGDNTTHKVLCDEQGRPIIVTKAGTGSGDSGYQGIHFIIIQKSAFESLESVTQYYDTTVPSTLDDVSNDNRYVTFIKSDRSTYDSRSETIKNDVKNFDTNVSYRIYETALAAAKEKYPELTIDSTVESKITAYLTANRTSTAYSAKDSYEDTWETYIDLLQVQSMCDPLKISSILENGDPADYTAYCNAFGISTTELLID